MGERCEVTTLEYYFKTYGNIALQRRMVSDRWRTDAFARAIAEVVHKGDVVLDVGTGTGILAMMAAKAGARRVYAVDQSESAKAAMALVKANGLDDIVRVFHGPAEELKLEEKVDVLVSEWLGHFAFVEAMLDDVLQARDSHLKPDGRMLPGTVDAMLAPIDDPVLYVHDGPGFWRDPVHGLDFSLLEAAELKMGRAIQRRVAHGALLSPGRPLASLELKTARVDSQWKSGNLEFPVRRDGVLNGFVGWFETQLSESERLDTGPDKPETHWSQTYLPFPPQRVRKDTSLLVDFNLERDHEVRRDLKLTLSVGSTSQSYVLE